MSVWGIDISHYQPSMPAAQMAQNGAKFVIVKATSGASLVDDRLLQHVTEARSAGLKLGLYHWVDPIQSAPANANHFLNQINTLKPDFVALDVEQWWSDWNKFWSFNRKEIPATAVPRLSPDVISAVSKEAVEIVAAQAKLPTLVYTARWFQSYAPGLASWIGNWPLWVASYFDYNKSNYTQTWTQFQTTLGSLGSSPTLPNGALSWKFWQFSAKIILPGVTFPMDMDVFNGSQADFDAFLQPSGPRPVGKPYRVLADNLVIQGGPGMSFPALGLVHKDEIIEVERIENDYAKIVAPDERWVCIGIPYIKEV